MKILLINPEVPNTFWSLKYALKFVSKKALLPPIGLLTVAAMLPENWELKLIDMNVTGLRNKHLKWADMVFTTGMAVQKNSVDQIVKRCKDLNVTIVAGGPLFTAFPEPYEDIGHLVLKEAEITLPKFLKDLEEGHPQRYYTTREKPDLGTTPIPRWDLIQMKQYAMMGIQYSRGCPFDCDFCDVTRLFGHRLRTKTTGQILAELD
ncbi:MAG TPA: B12-binding domain-containing radical SAM protein, partial [Phycisphaerales bacterium]|nr:B12-binding domain-containing radical SAM protein [Phycisphaerales bacterium]